MLRDDIRQVLQSLHQIVWNDLISTYLQEIHLHDIQDLTATAIPDFDRSFNWDLKYDRPVDRRRR
jgi:hypothetical protein